jgi:CheY-like chemotaxis protein
MGTGNPQTILIVDDDADIREGLRELLEFEGYAVLTAANGREALDVIARSGAPSLVLLDLMMPIMSGWEFVAAVNSDGPSLPICIISAFTDRTPPQACAALRKPIEIEHLLRIVEQHC